jgi:8-oxo-dGTP diphosphatase
MIHVTAGIITRDNKVLVAQRGIHQTRSFLWELPGGKVHENETLKECLKRELFEEFAIQANIGDLFMAHHHVYPDLELTLSAFFVNSFKGEIKLLAHHNIAWIDFNEFTNFNFADADVPIMKKLSTIKPEK